MHHNDICPWTKKGGDIAMIIEVIEETREVSIEASHDHIHT